MTFDRRRALSFLPIALPAAAVITAYVFFASVGHWEFHRVRIYQHFTHLGEGYYSKLADGFLSGRVSMTYAPDPRLAALRDPYDYGARETQNIEYLWDASYYRGKYYLYFSPVPVLLFYIPFRIVGGGFPPDALAAVFFCTWAFIATVTFVVRATRARKRHVPLPVWILVLGIGNVVPFMLPYVRVYEVAIFTAMAMSATWAVALQRFLETRTRSSAVWMGVWLALAIATRPNLLVLLLVTALAIWRGEHRRTSAIAAAIPLAIVFLAMVTYNYARFGKPFELGVKYQMTFVSMRHYPVCRVCTLPEVLRVINSAGHYVFWAPTVGSEFPFVDLQRTRLDPHTSFPGTGENVAGVAALVPLTLFGSVFAMLAVTRREERDAGTRAALHVMAGAWLVLLGLSACWWVTTRYALDFMLLMVAATIVCIEGGLTQLAAAGFSIRPLRVAAAILACYSILLGFFLGFMGAEGTFEYSNPELFHKLQEYGNKKR
ncbi:MAG TPA: hypothetical protein VN181_06835 [Thermoanaerobaculia bacterium]|nr:hypothetical protein [Thermoanaerobaculia bacterium]